MPFDFILSHFSESRSAVGVSLLVTLLQRDLEFWLKHTYVRQQSSSSSIDAQPLIKYLFQKKANIEPYFKRLCEEIRPLFRESKDHTFQSLPVRLANK